MLVVGFLVGRRDEPDGVAFIHCALSVERDVRCVGWMGKMKRMHGLVQHI